MENLAETFLNLDKKEIAILKGVERGMRKYEWVPLPDLVQITKLSPKAVDRGLSSLIDQKLIFRTWEPYEGYQIGFAGYDTVALANLVDRDVVLSLGDELGVGKESVVYEALGKGDEPLAIKFHRQGLTSFKHVRRSRDLLADQPRCSWLQAARQAARREFEVLKRLHPHVSVPRPVALSQHALVMELVEGVELYKVNLLNPEEVLEMILEEVAEAWKIGFVHADLSAYNVLVGKEDLCIIDWPQAVSARHKQAQKLLQRDLKNVIVHFQRSYHIEISQVEGLSRVLGEDADVDGEEEVETEAESDATDCGVVPSPG